MAAAEARGIHPNPITVARDGIAVIVHPENPVNELTMEQLHGIYTGAITNWNEVGGADQSIVVLSRESSSGTYVFFQEHVLNREDYAASARLMPATSAIVQSVASDVGSIGYVGLGYAAGAADRIKAVAVKVTPDAEAVAPSEEAVAAGTYSIARSLYFYSDGQPTGTLQAFVQYCLSPAGQQVVRETGYVPVSQGASN